MIENIIKVVGYDNMGYIVGFLFLIAGILDFFYSLSLIKYLLVISFVIACGTSIKQAILYKESVSWPSVNSTISNSELVRIQSAVKVIKGQANGPFENQGQVKYDLDLEYTYSVGGKSYTGYNIMPEIGFIQNIQSLAGKFAAVPKGSAMVQASFPTADQFKKIAGEAGASYRTDGSSRQINVFNSMDDAISMQKKYSKGSSINVYYNPKNPEERSLEKLPASFANKLPFIVTVAGIVMFAALYFFFLRSK